MIKIYDLLWFLLQYLCNEMTLRFQKQLRMSFTHNNHLRNKKNTILILMQPKVEG